MNKIVLVVGLCLSVAGMAQASEHEVAQKGKKFSVKELKIKVGDEVNFPNHDPFFHNVFSLSQVKSFDLGSYKKGESRSLIFEEPGTIDVECAIHPKMHMVIIVE